MFLLRSARANANAKPPGSASLVGCGRYGFIMEEVGQR
jgi:hypothetical protein